METQQANDQIRQKVESVTRCLAEVQMDVQLRDQRISDLEEILFNNGVTMERGLQECCAGLRQAHIPEKGQVSEAAYHEHAKNTEQALSELRSQLSIYEKEVPGW